MLKQQGIEVGKEVNIDLSFRDKISREIYHNRPGGLLMSKSVDYKVVSLHFVAVVAGAVGGVTAGNSGQRKGTAKAYPVP